MSNIESAESVASALVGVMPTVAEREARVLRSRKSREAQVTEAREGDKVRQGFGARRLKLDYKFRDPAKNNEWVLYVANDVNLDIYLEGGYEYVNRDEVYLAAGTSPEGGDVGTRVRQRVGINEFGRPEYGYLLKIRRDWWESDRQELHKQADARFKSSVEASFRGE